MSTQVQSIETVQSPTEDRQVLGTQNTKVQNKIVNFVEQNTSFSKSRVEFVELNKAYRDLPLESKPVESVQLVEKKLKDNKGNEITVVQDVKRKQFPKPETEALFNDLKRKRKDILRFNKAATVYINMLCEKIIEDLISSCKPIHQGKKSQEKTLGWKQFNNQEFKKSFTFSLVTNSTYFNSFLEVRNSIRQFSMDKEIMRLKQNFTKAETTSVIQDIQKFKQLQLNVEKHSAEEVQRLVDEEFGAEWAQHLSGVYEVLTFLQAEDDQSKFLFNSVKNVTKSLQGPKVDDQVQTKLKISNGFKNLVSKVIRQTLTVLAYKLEVYLDKSSNHQIKLDDIRKVVTLMVTFDDIPELKKQMSEFDESVSARLSDIQSARNDKKSAQSTSSTTQ